MLNLQNLGFLILVILVVTLLTTPISASELDSYAVSILKDGEFYVIAGNIYTEKTESDIFALTVKEDGSIGWSIRIGGNGSDHVRKLIKTRDGGYIMTGYTDSFGSDKSNILLVKLNSRGNVEWAETLEGSGDDRAFDIAISLDGGYIVVGSTSSFSQPESDALIVKLDCWGNLEWAKTLGEPYYDDVLRAVKPCRQGYLTVGETWSFRVSMSDILVLKLDNYGKPLWTVTVGGGKYEGAYDFIEIDDGYVLTGSSWSYWFGLDDAFVLKLNSTGSLCWFKAIGGEDHDGSYKILPHSSGYTIVGFTYSFGAGESDVMVVKFGRFETPIWGKVIGGRDDENAYSAYPTSDGGLVLAGYSSSFNAAGLKEPLILKLNSDGTVEWAFLMTLSFSDSVDMDLTMFRETHRMIKRRWMDWIMDVEPKVKAREVVLRDVNLIVRRVNVSVDVMGVPVRKVQLKVGDMEVRSDPLKMIQNWIFSHIALLALLLPLIVMLLFFAIKFIAPWFTKAIKKILQAFGLKEHIHRDS